MLAVIQVVTILQGLFLLGVLYTNRKIYKKSVLWLLLGTIASVICFIIGDQHNNLFSENINWFLFHNPLFVTFLFLFIKYYVSGTKEFHKNDLIFFIPNLLYFIYEFIFVTSEKIVIELFGLGIDLFFICYLFFGVILLFKSHKKQWILIFCFPIALLTLASIINGVLPWIGFNEIATFNDANFISLAHLTVALLFYFVSIKIIIAPSNEALLKMRKLDVHKPVSLKDK